MHMYANKLSRYVGYMEVTRPLNTAFLMLITALTPHIIGATLSDLQMTSLTLAALSLGLISAGAYALNDYHDVEIDKINVPYRSIPRGAVSVAEVKKLGSSLTGVGVLISWFVTIPAPLILCTYTILLLLYNKKYKKSIFKNLLIGVACGFSVLVGTVVAQTVNLISILFMIFIVITTIARELYKDIEDLEGDRYLNIHTIPSRLGPGVATLIASGLLAIVVVFSPMFYLFGFMNSKYLLIVLSADLIFLYCIVSS